MKSMMFAIKAEVSDPWADTFTFSAQKTMYGGKHIAKGDTIFVFARERRRAGSHRERRRNLGQSDHKKTRDRPAGPVPECPRLWHPLFSGHQPSGGSPYLTYGPTFCYSW